MDATLLKIILLIAAVAMPVWIAWRKANKRPWMGPWVLIVGLLILPYLLTIWLQPEWLNHPVSFLAKHLVLLPAFFSLAALAGGLVYILVPLVLALLLSAGKGLGAAFKDVEWRWEEEEDEDGCYTKLVDPLGKDWVNDWKYGYYRD